ncbi:MFS transporter [Bacteroides sp. 214]|uniref:sugar MFS transporter n=1 Tax=Bacteroides sp. 214 TaxID=2302935 RepID=UPI0013D8DBD4|nr:sugar MFS transporter [Bacteroides sp. 214]NDW11409.1 MFS transporter [Bacteroides sp. 214]
MKSILKSSTGKSFLVAFILVSSLYLMWGCAHGLLDVLNKHFQGAFEMSKAESGFVQFSTYIAYFIMALPAGFIIRKIGYKKGIVIGLLLFALGAFAFIPSAFLHSPVPFLIALFVLACGLCIIETGAHPYITVMGAEEYAAQRINIAAGFNGIGWIIGPIIGGALIFGSSPEDEMALAKPYILVGVVVLIITIIFALTKLPQIEIEQDTVTEGDVAAKNVSIWKYKGFVLAVIAQFLYCGAQTGIFSFFINYVTELEPSLTNLQASQLLGFGGMFLFLIGRLSCSLIMRWLKPETVLLTFGLLASICMVAVVLSIGKVSLCALYASFFFMSTMFPTIFALGVKGMNDKQTKKASSFLVMGVAGGAVFPILMGAIGETHMGLGFVLPLLGFLFISYFGFWKSRRVAE